MLERGAPASEFRLVDELFANPFMTIRQVSEILHMTLPGARRVIGKLVSSGIVQERRSSRPMQFVAEEILEILDAPEA